MRRFALALLVISASVLSMGVSSCKPKTIELTILHTNDIHSHLRAPKNDPYQLGGLARMSTLLQRLRAESPRSITLDAGDFSEGTWYYALDNGINMLQFLDTMGYQAAALGNHDFLAGPDVVADMIDKANVSFPVLAANLDFSKYPNGERLKALLPRYAIRTVDGLKIGLVGLTTHSILYESFFDPVRITSIYAAAEDLAEMLRPMVDVLIIISHNSFKSNIALANRVPGVDVVISGHSHVKTPHAVMGGGFNREVPVVETGKWGQFVGELKLEVDPVNKQSKVKSYQLHPVSVDIPEDPEVVRKVDEQDQRLNEKYNDDIYRVIADSEFDLRASAEGETPLALLAAKAYRAATAADIGLEESALTAVDLPKGKVTLQDLHDVVPHIYNPGTQNEWTVHLWNAKGSDIDLLFQVFYTINGLAPFGALGWISADNLHLVWDPGLTTMAERDPESFEPLAGTEPMTAPTPLPSPVPGSIPSVKFITIGGKPLDRHARYQVAITDGLLRSLRIANDKFFLGMDLSQVSDTGIEAWRSIVGYVESGKNLTLDNLRMGQGAVDQGSDLGVYYYGISWDHQKLSVEVENLGLKPSEPALVNCSSGKPNDSVSFETSSQKWRSIGNARVGSIIAGARATVQIPWSDADLNSGLWPVKCAVSISKKKDKYRQNNEATRVFRVESHSPELPSP